MSAAARLAPIAIVAALGVSWALPLGWVPWIAAVFVLGALAAIALRLSRDRTAAAAVACLAVVATISLAYSAYALTHARAFGSVTRLGYPLLVASGLRVEGGACLLLLCVLVSLVPALLPQQQISEGT